jgi:hypothetical protein
MSTEPQELRQEIENLKTAQATQTATQAGELATVTAMNAGTAAMVISGAVGLLAGMLMGLLIRGSSRSNRK